MEVIKKGVGIQGVKCTITRGYYSNSRVALKAFSEANGELYATLTVNLINQDIKENQVFLDSNNCPFAYEDLVKAGLIDDRILAIVKSGFCSYPLVELKC